MAEASSKPAITLATPVSDLAGVGKRRSQRLAHLSIRTVTDLLRHLPMRYELLHAETPIAQLPRQGVANARGLVVAARLQRSGGNKSRYEATIQDDTGSLNVVWFNATYLRDKIHPGLTIRLQGQVKSFQGYPQMVNPKWEAIDDEQPAEEADERLRPVYPATEDLPSRMLEQLIDQVLDAVLPQLADPLPEALVKKHNMPALADAFRMAHRPEHEEESNAARRRLAFNEMLLLQLGISLKRKYNQTQLAAPALRWSKATDEHIRERFAFKLTGDQDAVVDDIVRDLQRSEPMNRLVQGDVGSGKTVVALYALLMAVSNRKQGALMAPTELLAEQHYASISRVLEGSDVNVALLTAGRGASKSAARKQTVETIESGEVDIVIGTQALVTESLRFNDLAVVVVDEQHRFGVLQRAAFRSKAHAQEEGDEAGPRPSPHYLVMTATPIPRTLSLTVFGDLDISTIRHLPPGRSPIVTRVVTQDMADEVYGYIAKRLGDGEQVYIVVPVIEDSEDITAPQLKNVTDHAKHVQERYFSGYTVAAVHGRMKRDEREAIMAQFRDGAVQVLVATTVIEVGVDVPNATMIVVEHAERFGLAQLHQLRGRIGRGTRKVKNLCVFIAEANTETAKQRMEAIGSTTDGFRIAEHDLEIRGMGDFFGTRQHGMPPLRVATIPGDLDLLQLAKRDAETIVDEDPRLTDDQWQRLRKVLLQQYGDALGLIDVG